MRAFKEHEFQGLPDKNSFFFKFLSGKARRGDGNDLTSNPKKLAAIGKELDQLSKIINDLTPVSEMPFGARCKSRKEKNKLASRACRLKKKAQHEANKLKCEGLRNEHGKLIPHSPYNRSVNSSQEKQFQGRYGYQKKQDTSRNMNFLFFCARNKLD